MMQNQNIDSDNSFYNELLTLWPKIEEPKLLSSPFNYHLNQQQPPTEQPLALTTTTKSTMFNNSNPFFNNYNNSNDFNYSNSMSFDSLLFLDNGGSGYNSLDTSVTPSPTLASKTPSPPIIGGKSSPMLFYNDNKHHQFHHHQQQNDESILSIPIIFDDENNQFKNELTSPPPPSSLPSPSLMLLNHNDAMVQDLQQQIQKLSLNQDEKPQPSPSSSATSKFELSTNTNNTSLNNTTSSSAIVHNNFRTHHYCETVAVESTAHVAQIVGKNGCRIKHLRAKFGTYIHTPSATDEPVFIIKGQREKVLEVKQEIIKADNHFALIKDQRNAKISKMIDSQDAACIRLYIPNKYVGLVVGRNGWFVKDLQTRYNIYIETPKFDLCNYFQLYGQRDNILNVKKLIFDRITTRTGITFLERQDKEDVFIIE